MKFADLHIHSVYSKEKSVSKFPLWKLKRMTLEAILKMAKKRNLSAIAISDHDNIEASFKAEELAKKYDLIIIPAVEISTKDGHILAYGIKKNIQAKMNAQKTIEEIHQQGGLAVAAHPFSYQGLSAFYKLKKRKAVSLLPIDGIEVVSCVTGVSQRAKKTARILNLAEIGGSDAHCLSAIGYGVTVFPDSCLSAKDYLEIIRQRKTFAAIGRGARFWIWLRTLFDSRLRYLLGI